MCSSVSLHIRAKPIVAAFALSPSTMDCNSGKKNVMGDLYKHHPVVRACFKVFECFYSACSGDLGLSRFAGPQ